MPSSIRSNRWAQMAAWTVASVFVLGFFFDAIGMWTGPILGCWFVLTQKPVRGFCWLLAFAFFPSLLMSWRAFPHSGPDVAFTYLTWMLLAAVLGVLPFVFHRLISPRLTGLLSTLPLPLAAVALRVLLQPAVHSGVTPGNGFPTFLRLWLAAVVVWMWNLEFNAARIRRGVTFFAAAFATGEGLLISSRFSTTLAAGLAGIGTVFAWICAGAAVVLGGYALLKGGKARAWSQRQDTVALLRSPFTGSPLQVATERNGEALLSQAGERFPITDGIPNFLGPDDLTGDNGKYNHVYETIGGFYDDTQRVFCAFRGVDRESYFNDYMRLLEVKAGDHVLETSVGTGLNFKYLPAGVRLTGLDLSAEMLGGCRANLRRWGMEADLYLGNAERLPFADSSFDVVFHVGGISFFNDKGKAIREMIRVAKPGSLLLIEDETEDYARSTYERMPIAGSYYRNRTEAIKVPIDLVPAEMEHVHLEMLKDGKFFAITFRKPLSGAGEGKCEEHAEVATAGKC
jgi:ubiquinone/menaquinone biosynthesis C-methylase UbiE